MLSYFRVPLGWREVGRRTFREVIADNCLGMAAELAFYGFLALFPALLFLIALASYFPVSALMDQIMGALGQIAPPEVLEIVRDQIYKISQGEHGGILTIGILGAIWSSSAAVVSIIDTMNRAYGVTESRAWWRVRLRAILLTIGLAVFIILAFGLVIAGPELARNVADRFGLGPVFEWTWTIGQWPIVIALVASAIGGVYKFAPDAKQRWIWLLPGTLLATFLWLACSLAFRLYVTQFGRYNETYGTIGGVIVLMLWFYLSGFSVLVGAELNSEIEHASPFGKNAGEKVAGELSHAPVPETPPPGDNTREAAVVAREVARSVEKEPNCELDRVA